jgi:hypothetical protein
MAVRAASDPSSSTSTLVHIAEVSTMMLSSSCFDPRQSANS